jgi:hypothetical protein
MVEPKLPPSNAQKAQVGYTFTAQGAQTAHEKDVDVDFASLHHTIGKGPTQVAAGDHRHQATDISGLTIDHGGLTGLDDDDHIAYPTKTGARASGTWPINITGNAETVDGFSFAWSDTGVQETYILQAGTPAQQVDLFPSSQLSVGNSAALGGDAASRFGRIWTYDPGAAALRQGDMLLY